MRIAVLSDIHGNYWALGRVLLNVERRSVDSIVNLGDSLYGPLKPKEAFNLIKSNAIISISGNEDRLILEKFHNSPTLNYVLDELNEEATEWLKSQPKTFALEQDIFLCHGTPDSDSTYLIEQIYNVYVCVKNSEMIEDQLKGVKQKIVLCGHSHLPKIVQTRTRLIVNPGSVGCPAFDDDSPVYHKVETFSNYSRYCIVEILDGEVLIEQISVPYDYEKAVNCAMKNDRPDWAKWLQTGRV